jgi:hypothetical protein
MPKIKSLKLRLFNWIIKVSGNHKAARRAASAILFMELSGIKWYSMRWHWNNTHRIIQNLYTTIKKEMRGYQEPIFHVNPNVIICKDFSCLRSQEGGCDSGEFTAKCHESCFGVKENENGTLTSTWIDAAGEPTWLHLSCRDCRYYQTQCKGIDPKVIEEIKKHRLPDYASEQEFA